MLTMSRDEIAALIPHGNAMSVVDNVLACDKDSLLAQTEAHLRADNPLNDPQGSTVILVEYAAQAAAIHAALNKAGLGASRPAYLGAMKSINLHEKSMAHVTAALSVKVTCVLSDANGAIYDFDIKEEDKVIVDGRLVLVQP